MGGQPAKRSTSAARAATISRFKKERFLRSISEDEFRDKVVRPLFLRQGLMDGRELCGPFEKGKDTLFVARDPLGMQNVYVVQTKRGQLNLAKKASANVVEAATQLKTALQTKIVFTATRQGTFPTKAILCASGKINETARQHIFGEVQDPRVVFMDVDDLIPLLDDQFPELWLGMDAEIHPYLRSLRASIEGASENIGIGDVLPAGESVAAATDKMFVPLRLWRVFMKTKKRRGQVVQEPDFQEMPITGVVNKRERMFLILGEAGAGKSTALKRLAYVMAEKGLEGQGEPKIPVLLRALELSRRLEASLAEICADETARVAGSKKPSFSTDDLLNGRVVILIDALDELADNGARKSVLEVVRRFHSLYPNCQVLITSRDYGFVEKMEELGEFERYRVSPIHWRQAQQIIDRLHKGKSLPAESSKEIIRRLQDVHGLQLNPLLVTVFAATSEYSRRDIPANITELFKKFTEMMLGRWDATKGMAQQYHAPLKDFILTKVAFEIHRRRETGISLEEFRWLVEKELASRGYKADLDQLLDEMLNRSDLFRLVGEQVEFRHLLLQEFFAGRGIPSNDYLDTIVSDEWWKRAIVFYFGEHPGDSSGLDKILGSLSGRRAEERFIGSTTLGLALQACYLLEIKDKLKILGGVIEGLARSEEGVLETMGGAGKYPLTRFLGYYLFGRDSVALSILERNVEEISKGWTEGTLSKEEKDVRTFWLLVGLVEAGAIGKCESLVRGFKPNDPRLLLAIHLGCYLIQHLRFSTKEQRECAERISKALADRVEHLRAELLKEVKSELLEVRRGEIKALEPGEEQDQGEGTDPGRLGQGGR